jgi:hypothetical protein
MKARQERILAQPPCARANVGQGVIIFASQGEDHLLLSNPFTKIKQQQLLI